MLIEIIPNQAKCGGWKGHWECADKYPDHVVPRHLFGNKGEGDIQSMCRRCMNHRNSIDSPKSNPITNAISKEAYSYVGGEKAFYALDKETRKAVRAVARATLETEGLLPTTGSIAANPVSARVLPFDRGASLPEGKVTESERKAERAEQQIDYDPEGWVYIQIDHLKEPGMLKIGKTNNLRKRFRSAATQGDMEYLAYEPVDDCRAAETAIHKELKARRVMPWRPRSEWFHIELDEAIALVRLHCDLVNDPDFSKPVEILDIEISGDI